METIARIASRAGETAWWSDTWAWRGALAAAPLGALAAILHALVVLRAGWSESLTAYGVGALLAAGVGCLLGGPLGAAGRGLRRHLGTVSVVEPTPEEAAYLEHEERTYAAAA
jgi:ABC-type uncharacterized transport system permease subunit